MRAVDIPYDKRLGTLGRSIVCVFGLKECNGVLTQHLGVSVVRDRD